MLRMFLHSSKLTFEWKMDPLKMYFLLNMGIFQPATLVYQRVVQTHPNPILAIRVGPYQL